MNVSYAEITLFVLLACGAAALVLGRPARRRVPLLLAVSCSAAALGFRWSVRESALLSADAETASSIPLESRDRGYASSATCRACHPEQYETWHHSYHRTMTQRATPATVLAPFDGRRVAGHGEGDSYRVRRRGDEFWVESGDGSERQVVMVTGAHHQQRYWLRSTTGRAVDLFPLGYLVPERRWVPGEATFLIPPEGRMMENAGLWNRNCLGCHSVAPEPRLLADAPRADTTVAELGIACEACHGPGERHVSANRNPLARYARHWTRAGDPTIVNPARLSHDQSSQVCGQCHSVHVFKEPRVWRASGAGYRPAGDLRDDRYLMHRVSGPEEARRQGLPKAPAEYYDGRFWADGMVRVSGREYTALAESECHRRGKLSCITCHTMHGRDPNDQLAEDKDGDDACVPCHATEVEAGSEHTHHAPDSAGSRCYNCHMPHTTFGLLKAIRSHQIDSPVATSTRVGGRPNACNLCHLDRTLAWTAEHLDAWYGVAPSGLDADESSVAAGPLWSVRGDAGQRAIVAWHMGWAPARIASGSDWMAPFLAEMLDDPYAAVRFNAGRSIDSLPGFDRLNYDYVASRQDLSAAREKALALWRNGSRATGRSELLLTAAGTLADERVGDLLARRDNRPMFLNE